MSRQPPGLLTGYRGVLFCVLLLGGCTLGPALPTDLQGKSALVVGFSADETLSYEGGTLFTGFRIDRINGSPMAMGRYDYQLVDPGPTRVEGHCYWRLRSPLSFQDDLLEPGILELNTEPNARYTIHGSIDEYKAKCSLRVVITRPN